MYTVVMRGLQADFKTLSLAVEFIYEIPEGYIVVCIISQKKDGVPRRYQFFGINKESEAMALMKRAGLVYLNSITGNYIRTTKQLMSVYKAEDIKMVRCKHHPNYSGKNIPYHPSNEHCPSCARLWAYKRIRKDEMMEEGKK